MFLNNGDGCISSVNILNTEISLLPHDQRSPHSHDQTQRPPHSLHDQRPPHSPTTRHRETPQRPPQGTESWGGPLWLCWSAGLEGDRPRHRCVSWEHLVGVWGRERLKWACGPEAGLCLLPGRWIPWGRRSRVTPSPGPLDPGCPDWAQAARGHSSGPLVASGGRLSSGETARKLQGRRGGTAGRVPHRSSEPSRPRLLPGLAGRLGALGKARGKAFVSHIAEWPGGARGGESS